MKAVALLLFIASDPATGQAQPAFPSASGPAAETPGGRGGRVIEVTQLGDSGPGSLREALEATGPRTIVFRVGGTISLDSQLLIREPFLTVAGQTAPGGGILLRGNGTFDVVDIRAHDVVLRYLRIRNERGTPGTTDDVYLGSGAERVIIDHCSLSWANDELFSIWPTGDATVRDVTLSWSVLAETLEGHATAVLAGSDVDSTSIRGVVIHHNVFAHNTHRNPLVKVGQAIVSNNLVYDYRLWGVGLGGGIEADVVGNLFVPGPNTGARADNLILRRVNPRANPSIGPAGDPSLYIEDNLGPGCTEDTDPFACVFESDPWEPTGAFPAAPQRRTTGASLRFPVDQVPASMLEGVLSPTVGASERLNERGEWVSARDAVDARVLENLRTRTGRYIDTPNDVGGFPDIAGGEAYEDGDRDGMADVWESLHGFDATNPADGTEDSDGDGFTNLEEFLNGTTPRTIAIRPDAGSEPDGSASDDASTPVDGGATPDAAMADASADSVDVTGNCAAGGSPAFLWLLVAAWLGTRRRA
ncbi:MAG: hypothetical protein AAGF12_38415 [Myxococcota bacterium]